jgi:hypothetical protein
MDVAVSEDGLYAFGGVLRGSVELAAVYLGDAENYLNDRFATGKAAEDVSNVGLLDLVRVDRHADAKLKGFGAVARLWNGWEKTRAGDRPEYLLFTGKGIKVRLFTFHADSGFVTHVTDPVDISISDVKRIFISGHSSHHVSRTEKSRNLSGPVSTIHKQTERASLSFTFVITATDYRASPKVMIKNYVFGTYRGNKIE